MPFYYRLGQLPQKRHVQFRSPDGVLYSEELFGTEGFVGPSSTMYHINPPTQVYGWKSLYSTKTEYVEVETMRMRHVKSAPMRPFGEAVTGRVVLFGNSDVEMATCNPAVQMPYYYKNSKGDECSGWQRYDNKGRVIKKYEPFYDTGWAYQPEQETQLGQHATMYYDPRGQVIRTVNPDGSEQRVIYGIPVNLDNPPLSPWDTDRFTPTPWEACTYDPNDNAGRTHGSQEPHTFYTHHWNTPASIEIDALGRTIRAVARHRESPYEDGTLPPIEEHTTRSSYDIQGNLLEIRDALGRIAFEYQYDLVQHPLRTESIDAGHKITVLDAVGNPLEHRDAKGALTLHAYDDLNRPTHLWAREDQNDPMSLREQFLLCNCIFFFFGSGCKNDLDILAPYKDTTIVYGVLNAADTAQYIRIHKAYLGEGNAYEMAQYTDSFYYKSNLKVVLEEYNKGIKVNEIICEKDSNVIKEPGIFASSPNILFKTTGNDSLNEKSSYKLIMRNTETGKLITSTTNVLGKLLIEKPNNSPANFLDDPYELKWFTILNAQAYEVVIRFHYFEQKKNNPLDIEAKYFDWKAAYEEHPDNDSVHESKVALPKLEFFRVAAANIKADSTEDS